VTEPAAAFDDTPLLLQAPNSEEVRQSLHHHGVLRWWTGAYVLGGAAFAVIVTLNAVKQFALGETGMGLLLAWVVLMVAVFAVHLVIGIPGLLGGSHVSGAVSCYLHLRQRHGEGNERFVKAFKPGGPLDVAGVAPEHATEYMLLVHQAADCERYLETLRHRLEELREDEPDA
jgi:hypothetical protein